MGTVLFKEFSPTAVQSDQRLEQDYNHILDLTSWDDQIRDYIAQELNIKLSNDHITVIKLIRKSYKTRNKHPFVRVVTGDIEKKMGPEKGTMRDFYGLFPKGIHQAFQITGLPMQGFCF